MAKMRAAMAAVLVLENVTQAFGVPGAAINFLRGPARAQEHRPRAGAPRRGRLAHGRGLYPRPGRQYRRVHRHLGAAGTDMITGLYSASADSIPILCITGQAPRPPVQGGLPGGGHRIHRQAGDQVGGACGALVPRVLQQAFHLMRSGRPGPVLVDLPFDVQMAEIDFDIDTYEPLPVYQPRATRKQVEKALDMLAASDRP